MPDPVLIARLESEVAALEYEVQCLEDDLECTRHDLEQTDLLLDKARLGRYVEHDPAQIELPT